MSKKATPTRVPARAPVAAFAAIAAAALFVPGACRGPTPADRLLAKRPPPKVEWRGAMHEIFDSGSAAGTIELAPLLARPHLYALGPLADFTGELLVFDGTPFECRRAGGRIELSNEPELKTPLLVWSYVERWKEASVPDEARELPAFEEWLPKAALAAGLDASLPFAFVVVGAAERATIHVVSLPAGTPVTHENHDATKWTEELAGTPFSALGFHSTEAKGVWTHHDSNVHLHLHATLSGEVGHVEALTLAPGALVKFAWQ
jgi:acetolactate decarboxylase